MGTLDEVVGACSESRGCFETSLVVGGAILVNWATSSYTTSTLVGRGPCSSKDGWSKDDRVGFLTSDPSEPLV